MEGPPVQTALAYIRERSDGDPVDRRMRITLQFHPDWDFGSVSVLESLVRDGVYRSQFETGTSNGELAAYPGGLRWQWESRMFGGAYDNVPNSGRPVYGSLNFRHRRNGGSPLFGSAFLRLREEVLDRATFCYPDSSGPPCYAECEHFGTAERAGLIAFAAADEVDYLIDYVEAQVHGGVQLDRDVEAVVLDPCFRGTELEALARLLPCPVEWHAGFVLDIEDVRRHADYRTPEAVAFAERIAVGGWLTARILGEAAHAGRHHPKAVRYVWHYIARFGRPAETAGSPGDDDTLSSTLVAG